MCGHDTCAICFEHATVNTGLTGKRLGHYKRKGKFPKNPTDKLKCGHVFHIKCIKSWFFKQHTNGEGEDVYPQCPMCRKPIKFSNKNGAITWRLHREKELKNGLETDSDVSSVSSEDDSDWGSAWDSDSEAGSDGNDTSSEETDSEWEREWAELEAFVEAETESDTDSVPEAERGPETAMDLRAINNAAVARTSSGTAWFSAPYGAEQILRNLITYGTWSNWWGAPQRTPVQDWVRNIMRINDVIRMRGIVMSLADGDSSDASSDAGSDESSDAGSDASSDPSSDASSDWEISLDFGSNTGRVTSNSRGTAISLSQMGRGQYGHTITDRSYSRWPRFNGVKLRKYRGFYVGTRRDIIQPPRKELLSQAKKMRNHTKPKHTMRKDRRRGMSRQGQDFGCSRR